MGKRTRYLDHPDPEHQRWARKYPRFPGVAECVRQIKARKARGTWADIIVYELAENAASCLAEMIETFRSEPNGGIGLYIVMALEMAHLPESTDFFAEILQGSDPVLATYAERGLRAIDTPESRAILYRFNFKS